MAIKRLTIVPATAAALVPAGASASETPANYGSCVAHEAMFGEEPVREFTQFFSPATVVAGAQGLRRRGERLRPPRQWQQSVAARHPARGNVVPPPQPLPKAH
jgi:hypothetical protein